MITEWLDALQCNAPASDEAIRNAEEALGLRFPSDYHAFLRKTNGACGPIGETGYIDLWPVTELSERNEAYAVGEFAPGLLLIGSDGGDTAYAFQKPEMLLVEVPFIGMSIDESSEIAPTFDDAMRSLAAG